MELLTINVSVSVHTTDIPALHIMSYSACTAVFYKLTKPTISPIMSSATVYMQKSISSKYYLGGQIDRQG